MCNGGCGSCASKCGSSTQKDIPVKNLHPAQISQIKMLFEQYVEVTELILPSDVTNFDVETLTQAGKVITVMMKENVYDTETPTRVRFAFQL